MPKFGRKKWLACLVVSGFPALGLASGLTTDSHHLAAESPISFGYILQILASFIAVIAFIFVFAWLMRRSGRFSAASGKGLRVVSSLSLGLREKIMVVNVEGKNIVVGVAPGQIRTLYVMSGEEGAAGTPAETTGGAFGPLLGRLMK